MPKRKKSKTKARRHPKLSGGSNKGFDLGEQMGVMGISSPDLSKTLADAGVFSCAYGYDKVQGLASPLPAITLIGENAKAFKDVFEQFKNWGCEEDGDVVDIGILLHNDGSYEMRIGPELERAMYRTIPQAALCRSHMMNVYWLKMFDTTHPVLRKLEEYCRRSISAASR